METTERTAPAAAPARKGGIDKRTAKKRFLELLAEGNAAAYSAQEVGIARSTAYKWRDTDEEFAAAWDEAEVSAKENLERIAYKRAADSSDSLIMFLLKRRDPAYRDSHNVQVEHTGRVEVEHRGVDPGTLYAILKPAGAFDEVVDGEAVEDAEAVGELPSAQEVLSARPESEPAPSGVPLGLEP